MTPLDKIIRSEIAANGPMGVDAFMALALGHPEHGYYMTRDPFGRGGDFITAPEISQMFGELLGLWAADVWMKLGSPPRFDLLECGPGRGTLMADALRAVKTISGFIDAARVVLMEISPVLKQKQQEILRGCNVQWIGALSDPVIASSPHPLILIANEFLDALPVQQWQFTGVEWAERRISTDQNGTFSFTTSTRRKPGSILPDAQEGDIFETSSVRETFVKDVAKLLRSRRGAALFIDYGHEGGNGDTLQAVKSHAFAPVLENIGNSDLTSHVDFAALKQAAQPHVTVLGPVPQGVFLDRLGIRERAVKLNQPRELERLTAPAQMGRLFRVMALCHDAMPEGF